MRYIKREPSIAPSYNSRLDERIRRIVDAVKKDELIRGELYDIVKEVDGASFAALYELFHEKCAYCEQPILQLRGNIDRFRPPFGAQRQDGQVDQEHYFWLIGEWENLYLCCAECNSYKSNLFPISGTSSFGRSISELRLEERASLLDPCWDRPERHLEVRRGGFFHGRTRRGKATIKTLNLNRSELCYSRWSILQKFHELWSYSLNEEHWWPEDERLVELQSMLRHGNEHVGSIYLYLWQFCGKRERRLLDRVIVSGNSESAILSLLRGIGSLPMPNELRGPVDQDVDLNPGKELGDYRPIKFLTIFNFKGIARLAIEFPLTSTLDGNALAIVGQNSAGKSSVLQALALALIGPDAANQVFDDARTWLSEGAEKSSIVVGFWGTDASNSIEISSKSRRFAGRADRPTRVFGYGPYRLLAKRALQIEKRGKLYRLSSLFKDGERLNGFHQWIEGLNEKQRHDLAESLQLLLAAPNTIVTIKENSLLIQTNGRLHPINALSSGMQSMVSMCTDFAEPLYADSDSALRGSSVILVDELDAHLHPAWRIGIVNRLNRAFPNAHLIFSTHDPLTLRGLEAEQIQILYRNASGEVNVKRADWYSDSLDIDQVLTSDIFGLQDTHLPEWQGQVYEYNALLVKEKSGVSLTVEDITRLDLLSNELRDLGVLGRTKRERLIYGVIDRLLAQGGEPLDEWDPETMARLTEMVQAKIHQENTLEDAS